MNRATQLSDYFHADDGNTLHVYDDGFILLVACSAERHLLIQEVLLRDWPQVEEARSSDGFMSIFVLEGYVPTNKSGFNPLLVALTDGFTDHRRTKDWRTLDIVTQEAGEIK